MGWRPTPTGSSDTSGGGWWSSTIPTATRCSEPTGITATGDDRLTPPAGHPVRFDLDHHAPGLLVVVWVVPPDVPAGEGVDVVARPLLGQGHDRPGDREESVGVVRVDHRDAHAGVLDDGDVFPSPPLCVDDRATVVVVDPDGGDVWSPVRPQRRKVSERRLLERVDE